MECITLYNRNTIYQSGAWDMFEKVLLPTDFSNDSQRVLGYVGDIPGIRKVILLHVIDATRPSRKGWEHGPKTENAKILMEENRQALEKSGVQAEVAIETIVNAITQGDIPLTILEKAGMENVALIMMGARGKNTIQSILLGSVSASVIRRATTPVLIMRFPEATGDTGARRNLFSRILIPVDLSGPSLDALAMVKDISPAGKVILLHVVDKGESEAEIGEAVKTARKRLEAAGKGLAASGIIADVLVHVGYPPDEITATAERDDVSLILMSPRGEGWTRELRALFLGSTTNAVVRRAHCPVLVTAHRPAA
jgi:nucleotide-binding universal stress UspA family protein